MLREVSNSVILREVSKQNSAIGQAFDFEASIMTQQEITS